MATNIPDAVIKHNVPHQETSSHVWDQPMCLIENDDKNGLVINEKAKRRLAEIYDPVHVVAIVGKYRTGKSYLMNILACKKGFPLGDTVQAKTKGIWAWCLLHPTKPNNYLLLLDTEGLGDAEKGEKTNDMEIFVLAVLLSDMFVYNSIGAIDSNSIADLHYITKLSEHIKVNTKATDEENEEKFAEYVPSFVWTLRDFTLKLEVDNKTLTPDGYLDHALKLKPGSTAAAMKYNMPRMPIRSYFKDRKCFIFPYPVDDHKKMENLENMEISDLNKEFCKTSDSLCSYILDNVQPKLINGNILPCRAFVTLTEHYVEALKHGAVPCREDAVAMTSKVENERAVKQSIELYRKKMMDLEKPTETYAVLSETHHSCEQEAINLFKKMSIFDSNGEFFTKMTDLIKKEYKSISDENDQKSKDICGKLIANLYTPIKISVDNGDFSGKGCHAKYKNVMETLERNYSKTKGKGMQADHVLVKFMQERKLENSLILKSDKDLTNAAKQKEEDEQIKYVQAQELKASNDYKILMEKKLEDEKISNKNKLEEAEKLRQQEQVRLTQKHEKLMESKDRERQKLLEEMCTEEANDVAAKMANMQKMHKDNTMKMTNQFYEIQAAYQRENDRAYKLHMTEIAKQLAMNRRSSSFDCTIS